MFYIQEFQSYNGKVTNILCLEEDMLWTIAQDESSPMYVKYLEWLEEGNIPEPWSSEAV
jgi:hypothetical protein